MNKSTEETSWNCPNEKDNSFGVGGQIISRGADNKGKIVNVNTHEYSIMKRHSK